MLFGTDPEFVVVDATGKPVPAHRAGVRNKTHKHTHRNRTHEEAFFRDGYMLEVNAPPSHCRQSLSYSVQRTLGMANAFVAKRGYHLAARAAVKIDVAKDMQRAPVDVRQFGCEPSFCAHTGDTKIPPIDAMTHPFRYAGAHLHFSPQLIEFTPVKWDYPCLNRPEDYPDLAKLFDQYLGLPMACLMHTPAQYLRRRFYGQAGEYRPQMYTSIRIGFSSSSQVVPQRGIEYRTLGPELWNHPWLASLAMGLGRTVIMRFPELRKTLDAGRVDAVRHAINTGEERWNLLSSLRGEHMMNFNVSVWKHLYLRYRADKLASPLTFIGATHSTIEGGFHDWFEK